MRAVCWYGTGDVRVESVPDPVIEDPRQADWWIVADQGRLHLRPAAEGHDLVFPVDPDDLMGHLDRIYRVENLKRLAGTTRVNGSGPVALGVQASRRSDGITASFGCGASS